MSSPPALLSPARGASTVSSPLRIGSRCSGTLSRLIALSIAVGGARRPTPVCTQGGGSVAQTAAAKTGTRSAPRPPRPRAREPAAAVTDRERGGAGVVWRQWQVTAPSVLVAVLAVRFADRVQVDQSFGRCSRPCGSDHGQTTVRRETGRGSSATVCGECTAVWHRMAAVPGTLGTELRASRCEVVGASRPAAEMSALPRSVQS